MSCIGWVQASEIWALYVPSFHICLKSVCCSLVCHGLEVCLHSLPFVLWPFIWAAFWFPAPLRGWYLFFTGLYTSFGPFLDCLSFLSYYSVIPAVMTQSCWASLGLPFILSPSGLTWPLVFLLMGSYVLFSFSLGHPWPICFLWASLSILLTLHSHGLLLTSLGFPVPITSFSSLEFMGLPLTLYFLCLHYFWASLAHSYFSTSYTAHEYAISLFPSFFKPIYLLKVYLFISWTYDPSFLLLGPDGFATCLPTLCCPCCWAFFLPLGSSKMTLNNYYYYYYYYYYFWIL